MDQIRKNEEVGQNLIKRKRLPERLKKLKRTG
jgi:hypothetical protein